MTSKAILEQAVEQGGGVLRLDPAWVPRSFCRPGRRLKLHPDDYYALGLERGGIDERWFASAVGAENGPLAPSDEGYSYISCDAGRLTLAEAVAMEGRALLGRELWDKYGRWPMFSKFFDNMGPLPHHVHQDDAHAARVGSSGKPEMYFFPSQLNNHGGEFPFTFFGVSPGVTKDDVKAALENFTQGDNKLLDLSQAYKLTLDTGWDVPPGVLHAPGSLLTYEPQFASDVFAMYQSVLYGGHVVSEDLLWKNSPPEERGNVDYLIEVLDWALNADPDFRAHRFMAPLRVNPEREAEGLTEEWICYKSPVACAKRFTLKPGSRATIKQPCAYGIIAVQGHGRVGVHPLETPALIRFGQQTRDEYFITYGAAAEGVAYENTSDSEDLVILAHMPENEALRRLTIDN